VFSDRVGLNLGPVTLGVKRLVEPAVAPSISRVDLILSHAHMDHFDVPSLRGLENRNVTVVTASKTSDLLRVSNYGRVTELGWDERTRVGPAEIRAFRVNHWGARMRTIPTGVNAT
jgi:L-ascorbate metabolism protein UlaG (beta-lactamase superfamily)